MLNSQLSNRAGTFGEKSNVKVVLIFDFKWAPVARADAQQKESS